MRNTNPQLLRTPRIPRTALEAGSGFLSGLLLAGTYVGPMTLPLPIAIAANFGSIGASAVLVGSLISYLISGSITSNLPLLFALVVVCLRVFKRQPKSAARIAWSTGLYVFFSGIAVSLIFHASGAEVICYTITAGLTGCASYFTHAVFASMRKNGKIPLKSTDGCAAAVVLILAMAALSCYGVPAMNAGCIVSTAVTLLAARKFRCAGGVICGALTACGAILGAPDAGMPLLILPIGGLFVGYLAAQNRFVIAATFFLFSFMALITFGMRFFTFATVLNLFLGSVAFLFLDAACLDKWLVTDLSDKNDTAQPLSIQLQHMANAIHSVREDTDTIASLLPQKQTAHDLTRKACETVCGSCRNKLRCWETEYERTLSGFRKMEANVSAAASPVPEELVQCTRTERLRALFAHHASQRRKAHFFGCMHCGGPYGAFGAAFRCRRASLRSKPSSTGSIQQRAERKCPPPPDAIWLYLRISSCLLYRNRTHDD